VMFGPTPPQSAAYNQRALRALPDRRLSGSVPRQPAPPRSPSRQRQCSLGRGAFGSES
jgi:hypothetical protein